MQPGRRACGSPGRPSAQPSARRFAEPAAPVPAPLLAGAGVPHLPRGETESPRGSWSPESPSFGGRATLKASRFGRAPQRAGWPLPCLPLRPGARPRACVSKDRLGRQRELGRPWPCRVGLLRGRGGASQARSPQRFPRRSCPFGKVPLSSAASVGRLGPRGDETWPRPGGAPGPLR